MLKLGETTTHRTSEGEIVKADGSGIVIGYELDRSPEWRAFDDEQRVKRSRIGAPLTPTIHDNGLSTRVGWRDRDALDKKLSPQQKVQAYILRKTQRRLDRRQKILAIGLSEIDKGCDNLYLPKNALETASVIYRKAVKEKLVDRKPIQRVGAAITYIACRQCGIVRSLREVAQAFNEDEKDVGRDYRFLVKKSGRFIPPLKPGQYVSKIFNQLSMNGKSEEIAYKILAETKKKRLLWGRDPSGIAAAASYIGSMLGGERKTQREIAEIAQVTEVTLRTRYKEMMDRLQIEISL